MQKLRPFIVVSDGIDKNSFEELKNVSDFDVHPVSKISSEELNLLAPKMNGLIIRSATKVDAELLKSAAQLKYVIRAGEGTDNIDKTACQQLGVKVSNTPGANSNSVAELAVNLMLAVLRKSARAHCSMVAGLWEKSALEGFELTNKTIGLLGFGKIAQLVARRVAGFDPKILYYDVAPVTMNTTMNTSLPDVSKVSTLEGLFSQSDIVSIHLPKNEKTKNLVNKDLLSKMKPSAILINTARGGIVNENDLYSALIEKKIMGAGLDVYDNEPLVVESPLRKLENLVLMPHLGASTHEAQLRVGEIAVHQMKEFFLNNKLLNEVRG
ncbi:MAG: hydroxyacid dehydrogenase [Oligoflexia bacterium]|nr:hydroxyacid dehydrogenase [Oligoflexia bacterium]